MYQECPGGVYYAEFCNEILLKQATVDCLAASGTSHTDHYHRCLLKACRVDSSALDPTVAYIEHNCGEDGKSEAIVIISVSYEIAATDNTSQLCQMCSMGSLAENGTNNTSQLCQMCSI